jgi:multiple sugar transport system substrate-binding protein
VEYAESETGHDITYQPRSTDDLLTGTLLDYESEVATADIVVMPSPARIRSDAGNGHLEPVGDVWDGETYAVDPERVSVDGEVYAAPFKFDLKPGFWYRQSFFEEHDLSEPESYDEFVDLLDEISQIDGVDAPLASGNGDGWPLSDQTEAFFLKQDDGVELQEGLISGDVDFSDDRVMTALGEIQDLLQQGYFSEVRDFGVQYEFMWDGTHPLYFMGSWTPAIEAIQDVSDLGVFPLPGVNGMVASVNWFTVPTYSENVDAAREAVQVLSSAEGQRVWAERGGFLASSTEVPAEAYDAEIMAQLTQMAADTTVVADLDDSLGNPFQAEFWSQLKGLWATPDSDLDSITAALTDAQQSSLEEDDGG